MIQAIGTVWLPGPIVEKKTDEAGEITDIVRGAPEPAPALLTADEVYRMLRIDHLADPKQALQRLRTAGGKRGKSNLRGAQIGHDLRYPLDEVLRFIRERTEGGG